MRNISLLIILTFLFLKLKAQDFAPIGAKWYYSETNPGFVPSEDYYNYYYLYEVTKDTVIDGENCRKIEVTNFREISIEKPSEYVYDDSGRVYFYKHGKFGLYFDFNAKAGDTLHVWDNLLNPCNTDSIFEILIDSISTVIVSGDTLKEFHTGPLDTACGHDYRKQVVEGIGSANFFHASPLISIFWDDRPLRCYTDSNTYYNPFDWAWDCDFQLLDGIEVSIEENVEIFPNPFNSTFIVTLNNLKFETNLQIDIINILGEIQKTLSLTIKDKSIMLNADEWPKGVYYVRFKTTTGIFTKKLIKE